MEEVLDASSADASQHLFDPVNVFHLLNRYTNTWMKLHENVYKDNAIGWYDYLRNHKMLCETVFANRIPTDYCSVFKVTISFQPYL